METVNDGQFHSVELVMLNQTLNLVVDKGAPKSLGKLQKQPAVGTNSPLYLGGNAILPCPLWPCCSPAPTCTPLLGPQLLSAQSAKANQRQLPGRSDSQAAP